jgi:hypothetical protein
MSWNIMAVGAVGSCSRVVASISLLLSLLLHMPLRLRQRARTKISQPEAGQITWKQLLGSLSVGWALGSS